MKKYENILIVDCGYNIGSWSQIILNNKSENIKILGFDICNENIVFEPINKRPYYDGGSPNYINKNMNIYKIKKL